MSLTSTKVKWNRKQKKRKWPFQAHIPKPLLSTSGNPLVFRTQTSASAGWNFTNGYGTLEFACGLTPTEVFSLYMNPAMDGYKRQWVQVRSVHTLKVTPLQNFPVRLSMWKIKLRQPLNQFGTTLPMTEYIATYCALFGTSAASYTAAGFNFNYENVPWLKSLVKVKYMGETLLEPQVEKTIFVQKLNQFYNRPMTTLLTEGNPLVDGHPSMVYYLCSFSNPFAAAAATSGRVAGGNVATNHVIDTEVTVADQELEYTLTLDEPLAVNPVIMSRTYAASNPVTWGAAFV